MTKEYLIRKIAVVHAIKCNISTQYALAMASADRFGIINRKAHDANESEFEEINKSVDDWASEVPEETQTEINFLIYKKYETK